MKEDGDNYKRGEQILKEDGYEGGRGGRRAVPSSAWSSYIATGEGRALAAEMARGWSSVQYGAPMSWSRSIQSSPKACCEGRERSPNSESETRVRLDGAV